MPVAGLPLFLVGPDDRLWHETPPTDADGRVACETDARPLTVCTLPRRLLDPPARHAAESVREGAAALRPHLVRLGAATAAAGERRDLRLPADW